MRITLPDGSTLEGGPVLIARGHPDNPLPASEIEELFLRSAARATVPAVDAESALSKLRRLDTVADVDEIFSPLAGTLPG